MVLISLRLQGVYLTKEELISEYSERYLEARRKLANAIRRGASSEITEGGETREESQILWSQRSIGREKTEV